MNIRRSLCLAVVFIFLLSIFNVQSNVHAMDKQNGSDKSILEGKVNRKVSIKGGDLDQNLENIYLEVDKFKINENNMILDGKVIDDGNEREISLSGKLYKGNADNSAVGKLVDNFGNYEVIYFALSENVDPRSPIINKNLKSGNGIKLYLLKKNTRELSMFESPYKLIQYSKSLSELPKLDSENAFLEHWWLKVFEPTVEQIKVQPTIQSNTQLNTQSVIMSALGSYPTDKVAYYSNSYYFNISGGYYTNYVVKVSLSSSYRDLNYGSYDNARIEIYDDYTESNYPGATTNSTPYALMNVRVKATIGTPVESDISKFGDRIPSYYWAGSYSSGGSFSVDLSYGIWGIFGLSWNSSSDVSTTMQIPPTDTCGIDLTYPGYASKGQYYGLQMNKEAKFATTAPYGKYSTFTYYFDVLNRSSYQGTSNLSLYTTSAYN